MPQRPPVRVTPAQIAQMARARGLDPDAVLRVARAEGLSGGIGDAGHAFGPWQLNNAGGVITGRFQGQTPQQINKWAWSPEGVNFALGGISKVAGGLKGRQAVENIVRRYERPENPGGEIARALAGSGGGGTGAMTPAAPGPLPPSGPALVAGRPMNPLLAIIQSTRKTLGYQPTGRDPLAQMLAQRGPSQPQLNAQPLPYTPGTPPSFKTLPATQGQALGAAPLNQTGAWLKPGAKLIGEPYHGTHTVGNWQSDNAVDIAVPAGTPIYAPVAGKLGNTGLLSGEGASGGGRFSGQRVNLYGGGQGFYFAHLSQLAPGIAKGATVKQGQLLGYSGSANGVDHLHFGVQHGSPHGYYGGRRAAPRR